MLVLMADHDDIHPGLHSPDADLRKVIMLGQRTHFCIIRDDKAFKAHLLPQNARDDLG